MRYDISVVGHLRWEGGRGVADVEGHAVVEERGPLRGVGGMNDCLAVAVVARNVTL